MAIANQTFHNLFIKNLKKQQMKKKFQVCLILFMIFTKEIILLHKISFFIKTKNIQRIQLNLIIKKSNLMILNLKHYILIKLRKIYIILRKINNCLIKRYQKLMIRKYKIHFIYQSIDLIIHYIINVLFIIINKFKIIDH